jgi:hypothetical protein|tara:strand:+ start:736 stop:1671 length:936 start_codon:yes stop_codon:yes gene_type:complete
MKNLLLFAVVFIMALTSYSQKKKNGTVYIEHPSIALAEEMQQAFINGDIEKLAIYLADDFKAWNGNSTNKEAKGTNKEEFIKDSKQWSEGFSYLSIERQGKAYPDAIKYKGDTGLWVQTWDVLKGVHTKTGSKVNMPVHRLFEFNDENKIKTMIGYYNNNIFANIRRSYDERTNGVIYDNHKYINAVKMAFAAFENNDLEKAYSFFDENAMFRTSSTLPGGNSITLDELRTNNNNFLSLYTIDAIDMDGYPDYLHYERGNNDSVQSWWVFRLTRKSDNKKIVVPAFYTHTFNESGKIIFGSSYINEKLFDD